jgi:hypothetical protein
VGARRPAAPPVTAATTNITCMTEIRGDYAGFIKGRATLGHRTRGFTPASLPRCCELRSLCTLRQRTSVFQRHAPPGHEVRLLNQTVPAFELRPTAAPPAKLACQTAVKAYPLPLSGHFQHACHWEQHNPQRLGAHWPFSACLPLGAAHSPDTGCTLAACRAHLSFAALF